MDAIQHNYCQNDMCECRTYDAAKCILNLLNGVDNSTPSCTNHPFCVGEEIDSSNVELMYTPVRSIKGDWLSNLTKHEPGLDFFEAIFLYS